MINWIVVTHSTTPLMLNCINMGTEKISSTAKVILEIKENPNNSNRIYIKIDNIDSVILWANLSQVHIF